MWLVAAQEFRILPKDWDDLTVRQANELAWQCEQILEQQLPE